MKFYETRKGQIIIAAIGAVVALTTSIIAAWATANSRISEIDKTVAEVKITENLHYTELSKSIEKIDKKFDDLNNKLDLLFKQK